MSKRQHRTRDLLVMYTVGFILSVLLTLAAFAVVTQHLTDGWGLVYAITGMALLQLAVQLFFFLHLNDEPEPRWRLLLLDLAAVIVLIVVIGSLWIMNNLHYNMTPPANVEQDIINDEGIH